MKDRAEQVVLVVLTLVKDGELDLLPECLSGPELVVAQNLAAIVRDFRYVDSTEFDKLVQGKSAAFTAAFNRKFVEPVAARAKREEFYAAVRGILKGADVARFLPKGREAALANVRRELEALHAT